MCDHIDVATVAVFPHGLAVGTFFLFGILGWLCV